MLTFMSCTEQLNILFETVNIKYMQVGDLVLLNVNSWPQHLAIVSAIDPITIIHSYLQARKIIEQHLCKEWEKNIVAVYRIKQI